MGISDRWMRGPRPDPEVLNLIDAVKQSAETGQVRALVIVTVDPLLNIETAVAGDIDLVRKRLLSAGLIEACHALLRGPAAPPK